MELRSKRVCIMSLPGGDRRGTSGADAGCHSLRTVGGEELSRRALAGDKPEVTTADQIDQTSHHASNSPISSIVSSSSSFRYSPTSSSTCSMQSEDVVQTASYANGSVPTTDSSKTDRLDLIKKEVAEELKLTCSSQSQEVNVLDSNLLSSQSSPQIDVHSQNTVLTMRTDTQPEITPFSWTHRLETHHTLEINNTDDPIDQVSESNLERELVEKLRETLETYSDINPETRPRLPRLRETKKLYKLISLFNNKILPKFLNDNATMLEIHTLIYCTATVISKQLGYKIQQDTEIQRNQTKPDKQPWQIRLEKDIAALRVDIGRLTQYINNNNRSNKIVREVKLILSKNKIHSSHEGNNNTPQDVLDTLKQKLALKAHRLARYLKALRRKNDNKLFTTNEKGFYRQLGKSGNIDYDSNEQAALPDKEELKNYWADLWEHQKSHNEEAKWIKEEETRWGDIEEMEFEDLTKEDIETVTKKMKTGKLQGYNSYATQKLRHG
ncbi:hypothetical protein ABMA28_012512 [Loxostege sticticalis]|uniref:Uncharacterized protein n=1 Tax=Loxostege sticticalis TaxID=481309 RepID=A0ABD0S437_LOXSC